MRPHSERHPLALLADRAKMTEEETMNWLLREGHISNEIGEIEGPMTYSMVPKCDVARIYAMAEQAQARKAKA